jgi:hypothetical protein
VSASTFNQIVTGACISISIGARSTSRPYVPVGQVGAWSIPPPAETVGFSIAPSSLTCRDILERAPR